MEPYESLDEDGRAHALASLDLTSIPPAALGSRPALQATTTGPIDVGSTGDRRALCGRPNERTGDLRVVEKRQTPCTIFTELLGSLGGGLGVVFMLLHGGVSLPCKSVMGARGPGEPTGLMVDLFAAAMLAVAVAAGWAAGAFGVLRRWWLGAMAGAVAWVRSDDGTGAAPMPLDRLSTARSTRGRRQSCAQGSTIEAPLRRPGQVYRPRGIHLSSMRLSFFPRTGRPHESDGSHRPWRLP